MNYVIGIDGGGTKSDVLISDLCGEKLGGFRSGALNLNGESYENVKRNVADIFCTVSEMMTGIEKCLAVCIGVAGISNPTVVDFFKHAIDETGYKGSSQILGDHEIALYGATGKSEGIILVAGTGSICFGINAEGKSHRTGGFGHLIDDEGSGYAIGRDIISSVVRSHDGRIGKTVLCDMVFSALNCTSIQEIINFVYKKDTNKRDIAQLAPLLTKASDEKDGIALAIAEKCGEELVKLVFPLVEILDMEKADIALAGSILNTDPYIRESFEKRLKVLLPHARCIKPRNNAAHGAVIAALGRLTHTS